MNATYFTLTVDLAQEDAELAQSLLYDAGATGLEIRDHGEPTMPGVRAPLPGETLIVAFFANQEEATSGQQLIQEQYPNARLAMDEQQDQDWSNQWKSLIRSVSVGRLWVGPPWETPPSDKVCVVVEPKMAFGTGDHPTTSLCLEAVDDYLAQHPGAKVLDVGTGTGVLAIAALKLGASHAIGIDNDPISIELAQECAQENKVGHFEVSLKTLDHLSGPFDLVLANILANTLIEMAPAIVPQVKDRLVLAGVLTHQEKDVAQAYLQLGLKALPTKTQGEWVRLMFEKA